MIHALKVIVGLALIIWTLLALVEWAVPWAAEDRRAPVWSFIVLLSLLFVPLGVAYLYGAAWRL